ncbi:MAG: tyrosine--tRNA ligase [Gemmatimonadales bacterium]
MNDLLRTLAERGFVQDATPGLAERLAQGHITAYIGFDPTADSLHVGNLVPVMGLAWLQRAGGTPIPLLGGGTGMVGDPSGKRAERPVMSVEQIDANLESIRRQLAHFLSFSGPNAARMRNNADWLRKISLMEFLRDTGKHFTIGYMLQKESVRSRLETGISFTEFSYMLVQAYDFWHLFKVEGCELQMGGSDQWGNITAGSELVARREQRQVHGLVFPLLTTSSGAKFGKSEVGNVWLDSKRTPPYQFYQFWLNTEDQDVDRFLKLFTFFPLTQVEEIVARHRADPGKRLAQRALAEDVTRRVHGAEAVKQAIEASQALFQSEGAQVEKRLAPGVPRHAVSAAEFGAGMPLVDALVRVGLASSKGDARRGVQGKGFYVNGEQISDVDFRLREEDLEHDADGKTRYCVLRKGKKHHVALIVER